MCQSGLVMASRTFAPYYRWMLIWYLDMTKKLIHWPAKISPCCWAQEPKTEFSFFGSSYLLLWLQTEFVFLKLLVTFIDAAAELNVNVMYSFATQSVVSWTAASGNWLDMQKSIESAFRKFPRWFLCIFKSYFILVQIKHYEGKLRS